MAQSRAANVFNFLLLVASVVGPIWLGAQVHKCDQWSKYPMLEAACKYGAENPVKGACWLYFIVVDVAFWLVSLFQGNSWLIDPHWQFLPVLTLLWYAFHPTASFDRNRGMLVAGLLCLWAVRLTYNYFRREEWQFGERMDWRYQGFKDKFGKNWWWISFFAVGIVNHVLLFSVTLPLAAVYSSSVPLGPMDFVAAAVCLLGLYFETWGDYELRQFVLENAKKKPEEREPVLRRGVWNYSRHPNYVGEMLTWYGMALFALPLKAQPLWQTVIGSIIITSLFVFASVRMVEQRMVKPKWRREAYMKYQREVAPLFPFLHCPIGARIDPDKDD